MGLGGGKGGGGGKGKGGGGKGGKSLGGMLGGLPMVGGMFRPGGMMGGKGFPGMGGMPGMMGSSLTNMMNMFPQMMRGMGQPMFPGMGQMFPPFGQQQGQGGPTAWGQQLIPQPGGGPGNAQSGQGGIFDTTQNQNTPQPQGGGNMPALGTPAPSGGSGGPGQFALPRSQGYTNTDYGFSPDRGPQRTFGGFTGTPMAGGNKQMQFFDPRVNR